MTKANRHPEIQPLPKRLYKLVYGEEYNNTGDNAWRLRFSGLNRSERRAIEALARQVQFKSIYFIPEVDYPRGVKTPDLLIDGRKVEIKQVSSIRSAREQIHKAAKQVGSDGWTILDATKSGVSSTELTSVIEQRSALENMPRFALVRNNKLIAYKQAVEPTQPNKKGGLATTSFAGRDTKLTYTDIISDADAFVNPQNDEYWQQRAEERLVASERTGKAYYKRIEEAYNQALRNLTNELREMYRAYYRRYRGLDPSNLKEKIPNGTLKQFQKAVAELGLELPENYQGRLSRIEHLYAQAWLEAQKAGQMEKAISDEAYSEIYQEEYYHNAYDVARGTNTAPVFSILDQGTVDQVLNTKFYGENYSERIWSNTNVFADELQQLLTSAIASGQGPQKTIRQLRERFGVRKYYAERLLRTETNYFHNQAELDSYAELGISKYKILATLDMRTSEICQRMDGKTYYIKKAKVGINYPPLHPNCRTTVVAVLNGWAPKERGARDAGGNAVTVRGDMSYKEWKGQYIRPKLYNSGLKYSDSIFNNVDGKMISKSIKWTEQILASYPKLKNSLKERGGMLIATDNSRVHKGATARNNSQLSLSRYAYNDLGKYCKTLEKEIKAGEKMRIPKKYYDLYTITHEMGHVVENYLMGADALNESAPKAIRRDIINIAKRQTKKQEAELLKEMSGYGNRSPREFFAEAFVGYKLGSNNVWARAMKEYLKDKKL